MHNLKLEDYKRIHNNKRLYTLSEIVNKEILDIIDKTIIFNDLKIQFSHKPLLQKYNSKIQKLETFRFSNKVKRWVTGVIMESKKIILLIVDEFNNYDKIIIKSKVKEIKIKFIGKKN